jgi:hypothetical protein
MVLPELPKLGKCLGCGRILITDAYSLCWGCATGALEQQRPRAAGPEKFVEQLYTETGGEG